MSRALAVIATIVALVALVPANAATAHPLGNFTVNHYDGLHLTPDRVDDLAVIDSAEIPTTQERGRVDRDGDGTTSAGERAQHAASRCAALAAHARLTVGGQPARFTVHASSFDYRPGAAGLQTSRLTCLLTARVDLRREQRIRFLNPFQSDRIGWHEVTARATGIRLDHSSVPQRSVSQQLRSYPNDLLSSPLDVRSAELTTTPGTGSSALKDRISVVPGVGPLTRGLEPLNTAFTRLVGSRHLTVAVGLLALALSLLLGASHAALPGHGKTVMAAYIAGRRGSTRDALIVGATVTLTHTAGVIALGLALSAFTALAGDVVLRYLGISSGVLIAAIGVGLLANALHHHRPTAPAIDQHKEPALAISAAPTAQTTNSSTAAEHHNAQADHHGHRHHHDHPHHHRHRHDHAFGRPLGKAGLVGMGVAGGLVPSPSALVVLLGAIALGRTAFGVLLVIGYGLGMAAALTAAALLLVRLRQRLDGNTLTRHTTRLAPLPRLLPVLTASLVLTVGLALAARSAALPS